jgi:uncharacterized protein YqgC (DUF456 family)
MEISATSLDKKAIWVAPLMTFMSILIFCFTYFVYFYARQGGQPAGYWPALIGTAIFLFFNIGLTAPLFSPRYLVRHLPVVLLSCLVSGGGFLFLLNFLILNTLGS